MIDSTIAITLPHTMMPPCYFYQPVRYVDKRWYVVKLCTDCMRELNKEWKTGALRNTDARRDIVGTHDSTEV